MSNKKHGKCKLCLEEKKLCDSHIFPEYMYSSLYDEHHQFPEFDAGENGRRKMRSKGIYDLLLCKRCEEIIQKYEDYGYEVIYKKVKPHFQKYKHEFRLENYNYKYFKLFLLSLIWRASISKRYYQNVDLGPYTEDLRSILEEGKETDIDFFPCVIIHTHLSGKPVDGVFLEPYRAKAKADGKSIYQMLVDGFFIFIGVGYCSIKTFQTGSSVSPQNLRINTDSIKKIDPFMNAFNRLKKTNQYDIFKDQNEDIKSQ